MIRVSLVLALALLVACTPVRPQILDDAVASPSADSYPITIERGKWMMIDGVKLGIYLDGRLVAVVGGGQAVTIYAKKGRHIVGVGSGVAVKPGDNGNPINAEIAVDVSPSSAPILQTNVLAAGYGGWKIKRVN